MHFKPKFDDFLVGDEDYDVFRSEWNCFSMYTVYRKQLSTDFILELH